MARLARAVVPGAPHHVTQRGNRRQQVFFGDDDYRAYLSLLKEWSARHALRLWCYCLMPNHVHLILVPPSEQALGRGVGEAHRRYTRRVNFREGWRGHLWQGRFASFAMDDDYLIAAARYIERNPVRGGLVRRAEDWPYSSAAVHVGGQPADGCEGQWLSERTAGWVCTWREFLEHAGDGQETGDAVSAGAGGAHAAPGDAEAAIGRLLRKHESTGRPLGGVPFLQRCSRLLGRDLLPGKPGRPPKKRK